MMPTHRSHKDDNQVDALGLIGQLLGRELINRDW
jgi:hypothetical protein